MASESVAFDRAAGYYDRTRGFPDGVETAVEAAIAEHFANPNEAIEIPHSFHVQVYQLRA